MFDIEIEDALVALEAALFRDVGDRLARLAYADALETTGQEKLAAVQRELASLEPYATLTDEEREEILDTHVRWVGRDAHEDDRVYTELDEDLLVWWFQVRSPDGDGVKYLILRGRNGRDLAEARRKAGFSR